MKTDSEKRKILIEVSIDWDGYEDVHDEIIIEDAITTEKTGVSWKVVAPSSPLKPISELTEEHFSDLKYFWEEKGDIERYCDFEKLKPQIQEQIPELLKAWYDYKASIKIMDAVIRSL